MLSEKQIYRCLRSNVIFNGASFPIISIIRIAIFSSKLIFASSYQFHPDIKSEKEQIQSAIKAYNLGYISEEI